MGARTETRRRLPIGLRAGWPRLDSTRFLQWIETSCGQLAAVGNCDSNVLAELGELAVGCRLAGMATEPWSIRISSRLERLGQLRELKRLVMEIGEQQGRRRSKKFSECFSRRLGQPTARSAKRIYSKNLPYQPESQELRRLAYFMKANAGPGVSHILDRTAVYKRRRDSGQSLLAQLRRWRAIARSDG